MTEWLPDGRRMRLIEAFEFIEASGRSWPVPKDTVVDGASIPQAFWSIIGGPFEGPYRNASVVHDYYCEVRTRKSGDVHRVFYDGMRASGVGERRAWLMWKAVEQFGPKWQDPKIDPRCESVDEKYDFELCARNFVKPMVTVRRVRRGDLEQFAEEAKTRADPADLAKLRGVISQTPY